MSISRPRKNNTAFIKNIFGVRIPSSDWNYIILSTDLRIRMWTGGTNRAPSEIYANFNYYSITSHSGVLNKPPRKVCLLLKKGWSGGQRCGKDLGLRCTAKGEGKYKSLILFEIFLKPSRIVPAHSLEFTRPKILLLETFLTENFCPQPYARKRICLRPSAPFPRSFKYLH